MSEDAEVILFTDGACSGNPGPGGWAYLLRHVASGKMKKASGGENPSTNNRMELMAVIEGLKALSRSTSVRVVTDSQYVCKGMTEWVPGWRANDWRRGKNGKDGPVKNVELWQALVKVCEEHAVTFEHVYGHSGHPENEECDEMAVAAAREARCSG